MSAPLKSARPSLPGTGKPFECPACGRRVADKRSLRQHMAAAHPVAEAVAGKNPSTSVEVRR